MNTEIDIRNVLPAIHVPTLVMHRSGDRSVSVEEGRWMAGQIPDARFVELPGEDHMPWVGDQDAILDEVQEFLTGDRPEREPDRVLATVLVTDIVGSTRHAARLGDRAWSELLTRHHAIVRKELDRHRGREIDTAGDGFLATFDGPARAVGCACRIRDAVAALGIEIRAGLHTGEIELAGGKVRGIAVHTGARIASAADPGEILVSSTVKDLVSGSGITFRDRGTHALKDMPRSWQLFAAGVAPA
jgi:class 3 adenylate cyclase